ncbi:NifX-associated nitrogen fixation protein [Candidatus Thiothrix sp. Deng01]|uniref:NifX-associated nitrogen fixation protein n=1 Tax=Candidatus Thiothrix phosphatis TaxID=3112415 RepID=A0ABU6CSS8_9GAMM|nr:NifX-associated nitrogen fixation protein [Candidatus Thiothrix sp. Deng01]MEB4589891.1 NifX-associated nitrogen fixation protein [Candidatus Thiothrix sp. Deng01]
MSETSTLIAADDPVLSTEFATEMLRQMRAMDSYGTYDNYTPAKILEPFVLTKAMKREIPIIGDPDEITIARVKAFYNAIAALIEKECKLMAVPMINLTHEGFGRAIITVGKLVVVDRTLRDVHRFGFESLSKMKDEADKLLSVALTLVGEHSAVAGL